MTIYRQSISVRNIATGIFVLAMFSGCLSDEVDTKVVVGPTTDIDLSGSVGDGPVIGADMLVMTSSGDMIAEFQSDANAGYNITINATGPSYPLIIQATGGVDLVTGIAPDFEMSGAVFEESSSAVANVNPFSTFSVALARELPGGLTGVNLESAQETVSTVLNSGLASLVISGPMGSRIDQTNVAEIVKASEVLAERVRRSRDLLLASGLATSGDQVINALASDLLDTVIDGVGGASADRRTAAVSTIVNAQVLLEAMANELHVNGTNITNAMRTAVEQVSAASPNPTIDGLLVTAQMLSKARVGLAAAYFVDADPAILRLHTMVSDLQPGQNSTLVRVLFPAGYRNTLGNVLALIASADSATIDQVNAIARGNGDISVGNLAPTIQGVPAASVSVGAVYSFVPSAADANGDALVFDIVNRPFWANFDTSTGEISGTPSAAEVGSYMNILISVSDGELAAGLPSFTINVSANNTAPQISGTAPTSVDVGANYSFIPTASDADGDVLGFSIVGRPSWASFDTTSGSLSGAPSAADVGTFAGISISVSDGQLTASLPAFSIVVGAINSPPQISGTAPGSVKVGDNYSFTPTASDPDGDTLVFSVSSLPSWASFNATTGQISGVPAANDVGVYSNIIVAASDGQASASLSPFSITVDAVSLGSATLSWAAPTLNDDGSALTDLAGYKLYWGTTPGNYPNSVTINNVSVLTYVVDNLAPGTYEFVATSFNSAGVESRYSGTATKVVP
jgi:hypothetical protein